MDDTAWKTAWELARQIDCLPTISHERDRLINAIAAALRAERAAGRAEAKAEALRMAAGQMAWVEENSYAAQVDLRARIVAAIEAIP